MTKEQLLVPRWKVVSDFPGNTFYIGEIFDLPSEFTHQQIVIKGNNEEIDLDVDLHKYPLIFRKLEWWEDRQDKDLPKYIKKIDSGAIYEVEWNKYQNPPKCIFVWFNRDGISVNLTGQDQDVSLLKIYEPATEEEYLKQNNG